MNTHLIEKTWNDIAAHHHAIAETFYSRLFERHPEYAKLFKAETMATQIDRMVRTLAMVSSKADIPSAIRPHLNRVGQAHASLGLSQDDLNNFSRTMIEVIAEYCDAENGSWTFECERAWGEAFNAIVEPMMLEGMKH